MTSKVEFQIITPPAGLEIFVLRSDPETADAPAKARRCGPYDLLGIAVEAIGPNGLIDPDAEAAPGAIFYLIAEDSENGAGRWVGREGVVFEEPVANLRRAENQRRFDRDFERRQMAKAEVGPDGATQ